MLRGTCAKIAINGSNNQVTIENAKKLAVNGSGNTVDIVAADKIALTGSNNKIAYKKGLTGAKPKISTLGSGNKVTKLK